jgi:hypothetical protein
MIARNRLAFFLHNLAMSFGAATFSGVLRGSPWRGVLVIGGAILASAALTILFSSKRRMACRVSCVIFGVCGVVIVLRGGAASLSQTLGGVVVLLLALSLFVWDRREGLSGRE